MFRMVTKREMTVRMFGQTRKFWLWIALLMLTILGVPIIVNMFRMLNQISAVLFAGWALLTIATYVLCLEQERGK